MKVPHAGRAYIDVRKLRDYCLNVAHHRGKHKARVFRDALDLTVNDAEELAAALLKAVTTEECAKELFCGNNNQPPRCGGIK
jgi:hypothetical protein